MTLRKRLAGGETIPPSASDPRYEALRDLQRTLISQLSFVSSVITDWEFADKEREWGDEPHQTVREFDNSIADIAIGLGEAIERFYEVNRNNPFLSVKNP